MKHCILSILLSTLLCNVFAQSPMTYKNEDGEEHLCGPITLEDLVSAKKIKWFNKNYDNYEVPERFKKWSGNLQNTSVDIYLGTWCGDSKREVPKFVKLWEEMGLGVDQLNFIALYNGDDRYKQGPNGEEEGKKIHRVPTFIFYQNDTEIGRIVEKPVTDLETDVIQIGLGFPTSPNYRAAQYLLDLFENSTVEEIFKDFRYHLNAAYRLVSKSNELNTLGYVLLRAGKIDEALLVFRFNTRFFPYNPNVYDSYAEALAINGEKESAIKNYKKVLEIDPANKNAKEQLVRLKEPK